MRFMKNRRYFFTIVIFLILTGGTLVWVSSQIDDDIHPLDFDRSNSIEIEVQSVEIDEASPLFIISKERRELAKKIMNFFLEDPSYLEKIEKPKSFGGVEMVVHKSLFGFEITLPKKWVIASQVSVVEAGHNKGYVHRNFRIFTDENSKVSILFGAFLMEDFPADPDSTSVMINNQEAFFTIDPSGEGSMRFYFKESGRGYNLFLMTDTRWQTTTTEETLWILSTFKIIKDFEYDSRTDAKLPPPKDIPKG